MNGITIGTLRLMTKDLPEDTEILIENTNGSQYLPYQCGLARKYIPSKKYVFDGSAPEELLEPYDNVRFMLKIS